MEINLYNMKNSVKIFLAILFFTLVMNGFSQDKIDQSKAMLKNNSQGGGHHQRNRSNSSSRSDGSDNSFTSLIAEGVIEGFLFITYYTAIGNYELEDHLHSNLTTYPFCNGKSGNYEHPDAVPAKAQFLRFDLDNQILYNSESLFGNHLKFKIRPMQFFYLQGDFIQLVEYNKYNKDYSNLSLFYFNACYDRVRFEKFNFGWTLGASYIGNEINKTGFSIGLNTEFFMVKNVSLYSSAKWSSINTSVVNEFEIQGKYYLGRFFVSLGYEHLKIGTSGFDFLSLGGGIYL